MKRKEFIKHFGTILIFAVLGTILSTLFIGLLMWAIGMTKLFPVTPLIIEFFRILQ